MNKTITHKHLKRQFDIFNETEEIDDLFAELQFSTLLLPVDIESDTLAFPLLNFEDRKYAPVFTDVHEYNKCSQLSGFHLMPNDFDFYLNLLDEKIDGIIIDVEGERFPLTKEIRAFVSPNSTFDYDPNVFTIEEIKRMKESINNCELEEFLKDEANFWDYEKLMDLLLDANLFKVALSKDDLSCKAEDGVISLHEIGNLPSAITTKFTDSYALVYSSESEVKPKNNPMNPYLQLVNLPELIKRVLLDDLDGIVLNENTQNITIPREFLLDFLKDFNCPNIDEYDDYAFVLSD